MKQYIKIILFFPAWIIYKWFSDSFIHQELEVWKNVIRIDKVSELLNFCFYFELLEYRSVLYWRMGRKSLLLKKIYPPHTTLYCATSNQRIGKGLVIHHGHSTIIHATSVGQNCQIWQNVTIGKEKPGGTKPVIGNNVFIYTGAVVIGNIHIGDNVVIGANTVVTKSIPDNCTVVGNPAIIIRRNGIRVNEKL